MQMPYNILVFNTKLVVYFHGIVRGKLIFIFQEPGIYTVRDKMFETPLFSLPRKTKQFRTFVFPAWGREVEKE